jgi:hypothetical protein
VGTELGLFASYDTGKTWVSLYGEPPTVAVHDILVHPRERHPGHPAAPSGSSTTRPPCRPRARPTHEGRHLLPVRDGVRHSRRMTRYGIADWFFKGQNPPTGSFWLLLEGEAGPTRRWPSRSDAGGAVSAP